MKKTFEAGKALTFGLDVFTARPMAFVTLAVWTVLYGAVLGVFQLQAIGSEMAALSVDMTSDPTDPAASLTAIGRYLGLAFPFFVVATLLGIVAEAAWLRLFVRGEDGGVFPFRLGQDEIVYALSLLIVGLILFAGSVLASIAMVVIGLVFSALGPAGVAIGTALGAVVMMAVMVTILTLITPVLAFSVLRGRIAIVETFRGVRKIFWPFLGSLMVAMVGYMLSYALFTGLLGVMPFDEYGLQASGEVTHWATLFPYFVLVQVIAIIPAALLRGVACYAVLQIDDADGASPTP